jgi:cytochrome c-type biogenesis protein CcmH/NrfF
MFRLRGSLLLFAVAALSMAQIGSQLVTPEIARVGAHLACLCTSCRNTVGDCPMLGCHYAHPARQRIADMQKQGMGDQAIIDEFVKDTGLRALAVPPAEGFNALAWVMPFAAIAGGLLLILWFVRRIRQQPAPAAPADTELLKRYQEQMDKDLAKLD